MENERNIRFIYPPFILLFSLMMGIYLDNSQALDKIIPFFEKINIETIISLILGGGVLLLITGYLIGTLTITLLRIINFLLNRSRSYEINRKFNFKSIAKIILKKPNEKIKKKLRLYALVTYDHEFLPENTHKWIQRRWVTFHTSANSVTSLTLSLIIGKIFGLMICSWWGFLIFSLIVIYIVDSLLARKETLEMIEFQRKVGHKKDNNI